MHFKVIQKIRLLIRLVDYLALIFIDSFLIRVTFLDQNGLPKKGMKIEVNESVRSFVTEDSDEPALGGKIHTFSQKGALNPCRFFDQMLV